MFSSRRPGKRSIVGSRVCAPYTNGFYCAGVICAIESAGPWVKTSERYTIEFQDGVKKSFDRSDIIGAGFQAVSADRLKPGQTVYITHNGREVKGTVDCVDMDEVGVALGEVGGVIVQMKVDDIRLMESRRSARLSECQQDSVNDSGIYVMEFAGKRRSHEVDVPARRKAHCHNGHMTLDESSDNYYQQQQHYNNSNMTSVDNNSTNVAETMDEHMAALVLTSLSCSPSSPVLPVVFDYQGTVEFGSNTSSGVWTMKSSANSSPSPPKSVLSQSAPATSFTFRQLPQFDDDDVDDDVDDDDMSADNELVYSRKSTVYQCTWPGCCQRFTTCSTVENHIRSTHLQCSQGERHKRPATTTATTTTTATAVNGSGSCCCSSDDDESVPEEMFYYTELELHEPATSSSSTTTQQQQQQQQQLVSLTAMDHDYQRKEYRAKPLNIPKSAVGLHSSSLPQVVPVNIPNTGSNSPGWQSSTQWNSFSIDGLSFINSRSEATPTALKMSATSGNRKSRSSDIRKCRKVYGIENRSLWCTQCKWKKACTRFFDMN